MMKNLKGGQTIILNKWTQRANHLSLTAALEKSSNSKATSFVDSESELLETLDHAVLYCSCKGTEKQIVSPSDDIVHLHVKEEHDAQLQY